MPIFPIVIGRQLLKVGSPQYYRSSKRPQLNSKAPLQKEEGSSNSLYLTRVLLCESRSFIYLSAYLAVFVQHIAQEVLPSSCLRSQYPQ